MKTYLPINICYEDTDVGGVVYHSNYINYAERGRMQYLHEAGIYCKDMLNSPTPSGFMVRRVEVDYKSPAYLEDELIVETEIVNLGAATFDVNQIVKRGETTLVEMKIFVVCVNPGGKPIRIPADIRQKLEAFL